MKPYEKIDKLNELITNFGYHYNCKQDIFSTTVNAWQRNFGYSEFYNNNAHYLNIVFDSEPIYFDYNERTWLIEFWKGQYGINTGCEIGLYYSDTIIPPKLRKFTIFESVDDSNMLPLTLKLHNKECTIGKLKNKHWWLTIFDLGSYCEPSDLSMHIGITFPNIEMENAFVTALYEKGYSNENLCIRGLTVYILFDSCTTCSLNFIKKIQYNFAQWKNRISCKLFLKITKPFYTSLDRALCLYYYLPFFFRRLFIPKKYKKCSKHTKRKLCRKCKKYSKSEI